MKSRTSIFIAVVLLGASSVVSNLFAQANTVPAGYFTVSLTGGSPSSPGLSVVSFPLQDTASAAGQMVGVVTGITANTITNSAGGWTAGQLSAVATPYLIQFTSGAASGRTFLLSTATANTSTTVTLDPVDASQNDLTSLGIVAGTDTYQIIPADTLSSLFGTPATTGVIGGATSNVADQVQIINTGTGAWNSYYYNTTSGWVKTGIPSPGANVVIRPDAGVLFSRQSATLSLVLTGRVPSVGRKAAVSNNAITVLANNWPTDLTLKTSNIQNMPGWVSGAQAVADVVQVFNSANAWVSYYYNGTNWIKTGLIPSNGDNFALPAGSALLILKKNSTAGQSILSQNLPYSLN